MRDVWDGCQAVDFNLAGKLLISASRAAAIPSLYFMGVILCVLAASIESGAIISDLQPEAA